MFTLNYPPTPASEVEALRELGRHAVSCKHFRWLSGMAAQDPQTSWIFRCVSPSWVVGWVYQDGWAQPASDHRFQRALAAGPDLTDSATLGCLLTLVREAWDSPTAWVQKYGSLWVVTVTVGGIVRGRFDAPTEAEALVTALENAHVSK